MKLSTLINQYITYRKSLGESFLTNERRLKAFCKAIDPEIEINKISKNVVNLFLYGNKETDITSSWFARHTTLLGFYKYARTRGYVEKIPLPCILPKRPQPFVPYIYSKSELRQLLEAALCYQENKSFVQPYMIRVILILLYSTGLRGHEALSLTLNDINLEQNLITVRNSKFYKSRLIPIGDQLKNILAEYLERRAECKLSDEPGAPLFVGKNCLPLKHATFRGIFQRILKKQEFLEMEARLSPRDFMIYGTRLLCTILSVGIKKKRTFKNFSPFYRHIWVIAI